MVYNINTKNGNNRRRWKLQQLTRSLFLKCLYQTRRVSGRVYVCYEEEFEDTKGVIIIAISKNRQHNGQKNRQHNGQKNSQHNGQKKKGNQQTTIFKHYTYYTRSGSTNPTKIGGEIKCSGRISNSCSTCGTRRVTLVTNPMISHE